MTAGLPCYCSHIQSHSLPLFLPSAMTIDNHQEPSSNKHQIKPLPYPEVTYALNYILFMLHRIFLHQEKQTPPEELHSKDPMRSKTIRVGRFRPSHPDWAVTPVRGVFHAGRSPGVPPSLCRVPLQPSVAVGSPW